MTDTHAITDQQPSVDDVERRDDEAMACRGEEDELETDGAARAIEAEAERRTGTTLVELWRRVDEHLAGTRAAYAELARWWDAYAAAAVDAAGGTKLGAQEAPPEGAPLRMREVVAQLGGEEAEVRRLVREGRLRVVPGDDRPKRFVRADIERLAAERSAAAPEPTSERRARRKRGRHGSTEPTYDELVRAGGSVEVLPDRSGSEVRPTMWEDETDVDAE